MLEYILAVFANVSLDLGHFTETYSITFSRVLALPDLPLTVPVTPERQSLCF